MSACAGPRLRRDGDVGVTLSQEAGALGRPRLGVGKGSSRRHAGRGAGAPPTGGEPVTVAGDDHRLRMALGDGDGGIEVVHADR